MKQSIKYTVLFAAAILISAGCKKHDLASDRQQMIVFQYDLRSSSQHRGFIIDSEGNVYTYNNPADWNYPDHDFEISQKGVAENTGKCIFSGVKIPVSELVKYTKAIDFIALSKVTAPKQTGTDAGTVDYICYQYSVESQKYKGYLIKSEGDITRENLNFYSKRVSSWMKDIGNGLSFE
jgi:hypothetical protein